jgi:hypothetical protein
MIYINYNKSMKLINYLKGFNPKDTLSNVGSLMALTGSLMLVNIQSEVLDVKYEKQAQGLLGMSVVLIGFATGKSSNLTGGQ